MKINELQIRSTECDNGPGLLIFSFLVLIITNGTYIVDKNNRGGITGTNDGQS